MGHIRESIHINAPIDRVWALGADYTRWPEWQTNLVEVKETSGVPGEPGFAYTAVYRTLGRKIEAHFTVTKAEAPRFAEEKADMPGIGEITTTLVLQEAPDGGVFSTWTMDYEMTAGFVGSLLDRLLFERALEDRKSTRLNSSHIQKSRMPSSA